MGIEQTTTGKTVFENHAGFFCDYKQTDPIRRSLSNNNIFRNDQFVHLLTDVEMKGKVLVSIGSD